jgi:CheY-like chemotaxis protein
MGVQEDRGHAPRIDSREEQHGSRQELDCGFCVSAFDSGASAGSQAGSMKSENVGNVKNGSTEIRRAFILVVDDEKRIADTLALILGSKGYVSEAAYDAATALEVCRARTPNLLISDVVMPGMNGIELGIAIRRDFPACQVLLFSGQAATAEMLDDASAHGHSFELLAKPVHPVELLEKVEQLLGAGDIGTIPACAS